MTLETLKQRVEARLAKSFREDQIKEIMQNFEWAARTYTTPKRVAEALLHVW